jgi:hypothetical protein
MANNSGSHLYKNEKNGQVTAQTANTTGIMAVDSAFFKKYTLYFFVPLHLRSFEKKKTEKRDRVHGFCIFLLSDKNI